MDNIFITGMGRSGTTLLEKILHNHPEIAIASQPFPYVYVELKKEYYKKKKIFSRFPLDNYFLRGKNNLDEFYNFLKKYIITKDKLINILKKMKSYSGQYTSEVSNQKYSKYLNSGLFTKVYLDLLKIIKEIYWEEKIHYYGTKETFCEEYLPFILSEISNSKGIIIIRDPRDVITSFSYGNYKEHGGERRPTLFHIRNWRKSVAFALYLQDQSNFKLIKYEDLVINFYETLNKITSFLTVNNFKESIFKKGIKNQDGDIWKGNSSFEEKEFIDKSSIGKYKSILPNKVIKYIETCCYPEMKMLNYQFNGIDKFNEKYIREFIEPFDIPREVFNENYSYSQRHIKQEINRYYNLTKKISLKEKYKWYIFEEVYKKLRKVM